MFGDEISPRSSAPISADRIVYHFSRSRLLVPYLRELIIRETLEKWQRSPECQLLLASEKHVKPAENNYERSPAAERELLLGLYKRSEWGHLINSRFLAGKSQVDRVLFSAIQVTDLNLAEELYCRSQQGQSFTELATIYSQRPAAKMGGAVGTITLFQLHPLIYHHLIGLEPKQVSPIFQLDGYYIFVRLDRWIPAKLNDRTKQQLLNEFFEEWLERQIINRIGSIYYAQSTPIVELTESSDIVLASQEIPIKIQSKSTDLISPTSSFFFPSIMPTDNLSRAEDLGLRDIIVPSSFLFSKCANNISQSRDHHRHLLIQKIFTFVALFFLFLGCEIIVIRYGNILLKSIGVDTIYFRPPAKVRWRDIQ